MKLKKTLSVNDGLSVKIKERLRRPGQDSDINVIQKFVFLIDSDEIKDSINSFEPPKLQLNTFSGAISWWQYNSFQIKNNEGHEIPSVVISWMGGPVQRAAPACR